MTEQHTFEVFKWSGTFYNNTYTTSYKATIKDDDDDFEGGKAFGVGGDSDEKISIDGGDFGSSNFQPWAIDISFTDTGGEAHVETFYFMNTGGLGILPPGRTPNSPSGPNWAHTKATPRAGNMTTWSVLPPEP